MALLGGGVLSLGILFHRHREVAENPAEVGSATVDVKADSRTDGIGGVGPERLSDAMVAGDVRVAESRQAAESGREASSQGPELVVLPEARELVAALGRLDVVAGRVSSAQVTEWRGRLRAVIAMGADAVPAIREYLALNKDYLFGRENARALQYESVRDALIDSLRQIGGEVAIQATLETLQTTADPGEVLELARNLEKMAPGVHRAEMLDAARQVLGMAKQGELKDYDVGPLFEVFQKYGDASAIADLQQAGDKWKYYSTVALANLPESAGVPALIQMVTGPGGNRGLALELLAQLSARNADAKAAVAEQVRTGGVKANQWPYLAAVLGGDHYQLPESLWSAALDSSALEQQKTAHIAYGNQNFYQGPPPGGHSPEAIREQLGIVDELAALTVDPAALRSLAAAKQALQQRLGQLMAVPAGGGQ